MSKSIKQKAIEHYDRMIAWAEKQRVNGFPLLTIMFDEIGEHWDGEYCPYCLTYKSCSCCNLDIISKATFHCCNGLWSKMYRAKTWKTWIKYAKQVRQYIIDNG